MKKLISLVLVLVMVLGLFAACNKAPADDTKAPDQTNAPQKETEATIPPAEELEPVVLQWIHDGAEKEGTKDVIEVFNKKLAEIIPNTSIEVKFVADYKTNWPMMLAGGEVMDVAWVGWKTPMLQDTVDGSFTALNDLVAKYGPNIAKEQEIWSAAYASGTLDGELWMIPSVQPTVPEAQWIGWGSALDPYIDHDAFIKEVRSSKHMTEKILDLYEEAIQKGIDDGAFVVGNDDWNINWENLYGLGNMGYKIFPGTDLSYSVYDTKLENFYAFRGETPESKMVLRRVAEWYEKGWITQNALLGQLPEGSRQLIFVDGGSWNANWGMAQDQETGTYVNIKKDSRADGQNEHLILWNLPEESIVDPVAYGRENTYIVIPYTAENPERAMMVLNLLHDEIGTPGNDLYNLLCYGFKKGSPEAEQYGWYGYDAVEKDGQLVRADFTGEMHSMTNWIIGNTYKVLSDDTAMLTVSSKENCMKYYTETMTKLPTSPASNKAIVFDTIMTDHKNAVKAVVEEYKAMVFGGSCGVSEFEETYAEYLEKVYAAGIQAQIDMVREELANLK